MKKINGMIDFSTEDCFCRMFRGYTIHKNVYGMYTTVLENNKKYVIAQCDTIKTMKKIIRHDIEKGNEN